MDNDPMMTDHTPSGPKGIRPVGAAGSLLRGGSYPRRLDDEKLEVQSPPSAAHMPQGYCLLYVLDQDGVPSLGEFVKLN